MAKRTKLIPPALKHGLYSGMTLLPQEDRAAFEELRHSVFAEYEPNGPTEEEIVEEMSRLMWRKQNLVTYRLADEAKARHSSIYSALSPPLIFPMLGTHEEETRSPEELRDLRRQADQRARTELGPWLEIVEIGDVATTDHLLNEFAIIERINAMFDRCLKRLLMVRGIKSISRSTSKDSTSSNSKQAA
jgi:hypothetical protein